MKKIEIKAYSLEEAKEKAVEMGLTVVRNVTQSWKNAKSPVSDKDFKIFAVDMFEKQRLANTEGLGMIVCVVPGSQDTRKRPYEVVNNIVEGKKQIERVYEVRRKDTNELIATAAKKSDAEDAAKKAMAAVKTDLYCEIVYRVKEGKALAFEVKYVPSINAVLGTYIVFGNEKADF